MGQSSDFTPDIANTICERLIAGESLRAICRSDDMPHAATVCRWLAAKGEEFDAFREQYAHAREVQGEVYADRAVDEALTATDAATGRLRMDALKWAASKLAPKKYGDKIVQEHTGANGAALPSIQLQFVSQSGDPAS